jgi:hypothetical protein
MSFSVADLFPGGTAPIMAHILAFAWSWGCAIVWKLMSFFIGGLFRHENIIARTVGCEHDLGLCHGNQLESHSAAWRLRSVS